MSQGVSGATQNLMAIGEEIQATLEELERIRNEDRSVRSQSELEELEQRLAKITDTLQGLVSAELLQRSLLSAESKEEGKRLAKSYPKRVKDQGERNVTIIFLRGTKVSIRVTYFSTKHEKRKKRGHGFYPALLLLGIQDRCTPCLSSEVSMLAAALGSFEEVQKVLKERGIELNVKTIRAMAIGFAERAKMNLRVKSMPFGETVEGRRVVVSTDGGRIRIRKDIKGSKTKKGRRRYSTKWREPKLLIIYVVNSKGEIDRTFAPIIDGTLKGPDAIFARIQHYLKLLEIDKADKVLFVADGARWIWNRVPKLFESLGLAAEQCYELIDFYHAVEHLGKVAKLCKSWKAAQRKQWIGKQRKLLLNGEVEQVIEAIRTVSRKNKGKKIGTELRYFTTNRQRMKYSLVAGLELPIGSGAIESAIRRVVNLRLKGPSIFWLRENAEAMLTLRSYYKAGRWNLLKNRALMAPYREAA